MILGTAGHIDHGKTSLVRALTGIETDRLKEEKARGITIELGFAHLDLDGRRIGIVDVPGHERFVRHMVAGAGGIDVVMMVIAADEGVMPQTREHLEICDLMGIEHGFVALTKTDLVEADWLELVKEDLAEQLQGTFLAGKSVVPCSVFDDDSIDAIRSEMLAQLAVAKQENPHKLRMHIPRLPIDRVFTVHGFGTVVTGTLLGGSLAIAQEMELTPGGLATRIRGLQIHGEDVRGAQPGSRVAINLGGLDKDEVSRGQVVAPPGVLVESECLDVELSVLKHVREGLADRAPAMLHTLTQRVPVRLVILDDDRIHAGDTGFVQLRTDEPVSVVAGDRFVIRGFHSDRMHGKTLAGGRVLDPAAPHFRQRYREIHLQRLSGLSSSDVALAVETRLKAAGLNGNDREGLLVRVPFPRRRSEPELTALIQSGDAVEANGLLLHRSALDEGKERAVSFLSQYHRQNPDEPGAGKEALRNTVLGEADGAFQLLLDRLISDGAAVQDGEYIRLTSFDPPQDEELDRAIVAAYREAGLAGFEVDSLAAAIARPVSALRAAGKRMLREGVLVRVKPDYLVLTDELTELRKTLQDHFQKNDTLSIPGLRELTGLSRKHMVPLLEHLDRRGWTRREGDVRVAGPALE